MASKQPNFYCLFTRIGGALYLWLRGMLLGYHTPCCVVVPRGDAINWLALWLAFHQRA